MIILVFFFEKSVECRMKKLKRILKDFLIDSFKKILLFQFHRMQSFLRKEKSRRNNSFSSLLRNLLILSRSTFF